MKRERSELPEDLQRNLAETRARLECRREIERRDKLDRLINILATLPRSVIQALCEYAEHEGIAMTEALRYAISILVLIHKQADEDRIDVEAAREALAESDERIPYEQVRRELGLTE